MMRSLTDRGGPALLLALTLLGSAGGLHAQTGPKVHTVVIEAMQYSPAQLEVRAGDTVIWQNKDPFPHTATAQDRSFDSGMIASDGSWKWVANKTGTMPYICTLHPTMKANLTVR